ncbi:MAG: Ig-like domain-containing protein [Thermoleophilia bacterium]
MSRHFPTSAVRLAAAVLGAVALLAAAPLVGGPAGPFTAVADDCVPAGANPAVTQVNPAPGQASVGTDTAVTAEVSVPNCSGIDREAVASGSVVLRDATTNAVVPAVVNTSGGGDVIVLQPTVLLTPNRGYRFEVTAELTDESGTPFTPFSSTFTTGDGPNSGGGSFTGAFARQVTTAPALTGGIGYTGVAVGPDHKLYTSRNNGVITRFPITADGTLGAAEPVTGISAGGPRIVIGMAFDPASTPSNPILWVSHNQFSFTNAQDWTGVISRLTGPDLATRQDIVVGLPRSLRDHLTNSLAFHGGDLYFTQGANTAMGAADSAWGGRDERLLSAAVLKLDVSSVLSGALPLDVKTEDGGTYDPYAPGAPLTLYASGVRNAYDLVWHTNGQLYVPTNGSAAGGTTPASPSTLPASCTRRIDDAANGDYTGPNTIPSRNNTGAMPDYLYRVQQGGYYGHPNPARCEWVLNGGNPTAGADPAQVAAYPVGTQPDRNFRGFAFNFGNHFSPNGVIEYRGDAFGGALRGKLLVVRYSAGDDVIALTPNGGNGDISAYQTGITGLTGLVNPLDIAQDGTTGNLYIAEYPDPSKSSAPSRIVLAKPVAGGDTTRPAVAARTPAPDATGVAVDANVTATFSEPVAAASVTATSFTLTPSAGGLPVAAGVSRAPAANAATLDPAAPLAPGTRYTVTLTTEVTDLAGLPLTPDSWTFTTAPAPPAPVPAGPTPPGAGAAAPAAPAPPVAAPRARFTATGLTAAWNRRAGRLTLTLKGRDPRTTVQVGSRYLTPRKGKVVITRRAKGTLVVRVAPTPLSRGILTTRAWRVTLPAKGAPKVVRL